MKADKKGFTGLPVNIFLSLAAYKVLESA
jgi:hypothetical protein